MASRQEAKEAARQKRIAAEQAATAKAAQTRRLGMFAGIVVVAVVIAVVVIVVASGGKGSGLQTGQSASKTYRSVEAELQGIPQTGTTLGNASAKVTIEYFGDLECPVCKALTLGEDGGGLPQLIDGPVKSGQVKLEYRSLETASGAVNSSRFMPQQVAAYAAGQQGLFWQYAELFYHEQGSEDTRYVTESYLRGLADQIPDLNVTKWLSDRSHSALSAQVTADEKAATKYGLTGTPTLVAFGPKQAEIVPSQGVPTFAQIESAITAVS